MNTAPQHSLWLDTSKTFEQRAQALLNEMTVEEKLSQLTRRNAAIPRLNIPSYVWWNEALHGVARAGAATVFPQAIGMAATFSTERLSEMAEIIATEGRARHHESARKGDYGTYKGLTYWSPNVNIFRDPRWGRGHETYGECPFLTGSLGAAYVKGVQGEHPKYLKAVATPKHFAVHSGPEATRLSFDSVVDERDLRETYLPAFKACFDAGAQSVMTAYNAINGEPCATNTRLINDILRDEWAFDGAVVTDAGCPEALHLEHQRVDTLAEAVAKITHSGVDVVVGYQGDIEPAVDDAHASGLLQTEQLDRAIYNQLLIKMKLGFFDPETEVPLADTPYEVLECPQHLAAARRATAESLVLLRNDGNRLPLNKDALRSIAVIGPNADCRDVLLGNYHGTPTRFVTLLQGIQNAAPANSRIWHARGCEPIEARTEICAEDHDRYAEAIAVAERSDVAILCLGLNPSIEGEAGDASNAEAGGDRIRIELPQAQETLIEKVVATGTPVVVVMLSGSAIISPAIERLGLPMLHCWYPGAEAGDVIADTLFGTNNPAGRLPLTFYKSTDDLPPFEDYAMDGRTYRFFKGQPAYPFGFGLSYSEFQYSHLQLTRSDDGVQVQVTVTNTSERNGDEVVQIYASQAADFRTPQRSLVAFARHHIQAGTSETFEFLVPHAQLQLTAPDGSQAHQSGRIEFSVGGSQNDPRSIALMQRSPLIGTIKI